MSDTIHYTDASGYNHEFEIELESTGEERVHIDDRLGVAIVGYLSPDEDTRNPRKDHDNLGTLVTFRRWDNYDIGDEASKHDDPFEWLKEQIIDRFSSNKFEQQLVEWFEEVEDEDLILKYADRYFVYRWLDIREQAYMTMTTQSSPSKDGIIYVTKEQVKTEYGDVSEETCERVAGYLDAEVDEVDEVLRGHVYGIVYEIFVNSADKGEEPEWYRVERDDCWGYIGDDYAEEELADGMNRFIDGETGALLNALAKFAGENLPLAS